MPTKPTTAKKKPVLKKAAARKPAPKTTTKMTMASVPKAKMTAPKKAAAPATMTPKKSTMPSQRGFMWRLLEQKKAAQKQKTAGGGAKPSAFERFRAQNSNGFSRFHGPRRKAG